MSNPFEPPSPGRSAPSSEDRSDQLGPWLLDHRTVVATARVVWPRRCARCNVAVAPDAPRQVRAVSWVPSWTWLAAVLGLFPFIVVFAVYRRHATIAYFLCPSHARRDVLWGIGRQLLLLGLVVGGIVATGFSENPAWLLAVLAGIVLWLFVPANRLRATFIRGERVHVRGAGTAFVASLPDLDPAFGPEDELFDPDLLD